MAVDLFKDFATNLAAEEEGVWEEYGEGVAFLIARANNKKYNRQFTKGYEKNKRLFDSKTDAADSKAEEFMVDLGARTLLLGWRGPLNWDGVPMGDYSVEKAQKMLAIKDFRAWVLEKAGDIDRYKAAQKDEDAGK